MPPGASILCSLGPREAGDPTGIAKGRAAAELVAFLPDVPAVVGEVDARVGIVEHGADPDVWIDPVLGADLPAAQPVAETERVGLVVARTGGAGRLDEHSERALHQKRRLAGRRLHGH